MWNEGKTVTLIKAQWICWRQTLQMGIWNIFQKFIFTKNISHAQIYVQCTNKYLLQTFYITFIKKFTTLLFCLCYLTFLEKFCELWKLLVKNNMERNSLRIFEMALKCYTGGPISTATYENHLENIGDFHGPLSAPLPKLANWCISFGKFWKKCVCFSPFFQKFSKMFWKITYLGGHEFSPDCYFWFIFCVFFNKKA